MGSGEETVEIRTVEQIQESAGMRKAQQLQSMQKVQQLRIAGLCCDLVLPGDYERGQMRYPVLYVNGEIPAQEILAELKRAGGRADFILLCVRPDSWNDDFTPWPAPAFRRDEAPPQGRAQTYLARLAGEIKPYMDMHYRTKPEPEHAALAGYSLGGLTALYALYQTDCFGWVASLSGSLWYDGFCEYMEKERPLRREVNVYLSLGKKERLSRNPRMGKVAACTERARQILESQLGQVPAGEMKEEQADSRKGADDRSRSGEVCLEWNEGGHFHETAKRFARAILWWEGRNL